MPKKFKGENSKATVARDRKAAERAEQLAKKEAAEEDAAWADDDKHIARKQQRKEDKEKKRVEQLERKKELAKMADEELEAIKAAKPRAAQKLTRAQIEAEQERQRQAAVTAAEKEKQLVHTDQPLEDNFNRLKMEGDQAQTVEEAISVLSVSDPDLEKHPEKRMKAAFLKYEEENLPILKQENPNMRLSQLKQMLKKDWMKSPENPMNQRTAAFNEKR
ncbi:C124A-like protein [Mya arenaria]|uniref:C124A-like protein n=1 Tax=Mya arenaria TaxID=6604 RepID=A0ABY7DS37_MYAAR|nr:coiled-coil domain-containing protein 124-A-like isoform X1 [Mya arenaria]WAQ97775.1 C124A-like protein [Mya arenaria]